MPSIIKVKRSSTAGVVPASLSAGELAANTADSLIYVGTGSGVTAIRPRVSATDRVLGRSSAGAGPAEELVCTAQGRSIISAVDAAAQRSVLALGAMATSSGVTLTGDVTGSGTGSFAATLSNSGVSAGTYRSVTVDAKGRVTAGSNPTTLAGYGITDAVTAGGSGASGTWAISITGSAAQLGGVAASNYFRVDGTYANADLNVPVEGYWHVAPNAANLPDGALYGHRWDYDHAGDGNWVAQFYTPTSGDAGMWFRQRRGGTWQTWRKFLDSTTYNSYSPTLTGGGASGTWTINVTGTAATATRSTIQDTRAAQRTPNDYDDFQASYEFTNQFTGLPDWHTAFTMQGWSNGYASWQIIGPASTAAHENFYLRSGVNTTWNSVRAILHSGNYTSYSPTLTGGGASGTWGINVTGTAASETLATVTGRGASTASNITTTGAMYASNWYRSYGATGWFNETYAGGIWMSDSTYVRVYNNKVFYADNFIWSGTDVRAPIFYDSQNTAYYCDPNGTSRMAAMNIDSLQILGNDLYVGDQNSLYGTYSNIHMRDSDEGQRTIHCNSNRIGFLTQAGGWGAWCNDDGSWESVGRVTATEFYESGFAGRIFGAKAWCNHNGSTSPAAFADGSGNISTIGYRSATGRYRANFTTGITPYNAAFIGTAYGSGDSPSATMVRFSTRNVVNSRTTYIDYAVSVGGAYSGALDVMFVVVG